MQQDECGPLQLVSFFAALVIVHIENLAHHEQTLSCFEGSRHKIGGKLPGMLSDVVDEKIKKVPLKKGSL